MIEDILTRAKVLELKAKKALSEMENLAMLCADEAEENIFVMGYMAAHEMCETRQVVVCVINKDVVDAAELEYPIYESTSDADREYLMNQRRQFEKGWYACVAKQNELNHE